MPCTLLGKYAQIMQVTRIDMFHVYIYVYAYAWTLPDYAHLRNMFMFVYLDHGVLLMFIITLMLIICYAYWSTPFMHTFMFMTLDLFYVTPCVGTTQL